MIEVNGLSKNYGDVQALRDVTFTVGKGQIVGFLGANGAGKTTTMDILCGCLGPDQGQVKISGFDIVDNPIEAKQRLGYLPDEPPIYNEMLVEDYIAYAARLNRVPRSELKKQIDDTVSTLSLGDVRKRMIGNLSKGYRQRVALAQAIVHNPDVLVLDEPTEGLDPNQIVHIRELIRSLGGRHTIILSSHILSEVQNTCDHIIIIHKGSIVEQGTYEELATRISGVKQYRICVREKGEALVNILNTHPGVSAAHLLPGKTNEIEFAFSEPSVDSIARKVLDGGYGLVELSPKTRSLEEIYFEITH